MLSRRRHHLLLQHAAADRRLSEHARCSRPKIGDRAGSMISSRMLGARFARPARHALSRAPAPVRPNSSRSGPPIYSRRALCPAPFRVLAISFKSDAAENLAARVRKRCPPELASRFTSLTFDAFTKGLVDRFSLAIPAPLATGSPYDICVPDLAAG